MNYTPDDRRYVDAHRFLYGDLGEHVAACAILFRDRLMRPGFAPPVIRLAPVAPHGRMRGLSGNCHESGSFGDRITGRYDGGACGGRGPFDNAEIEALWARAKNAVQWWPR